MNKRARKIRLMAGIMCVSLLLTALFSAMAATTYPYQTTCMEAVNLRKTASSSAVIMKRIQAGASVKVLGVSGDYYQIEFDGATGYAIKQYVDGTTTGTEVAPVLADYLAPPIAITGYPYDTTAIANVKLRKTASDTATVLLVVPQDALLTVLDVTASGFAKVRYNGKTGYVMSSFLNLASFSIQTAAPTATPDPEAAKYTVLQMGSTGPAVSALQEALTELTYYNGAIDSKFGAQTLAALNALKKRNGMEEDGIADGALQKLLYEGTPKNPKGYRKIIKTLAPISGVTIKSGNKGEPVEKLQARLKELGYYMGEITGVCDKATVTSIKDFQQKHSLEKTGIADTQTQNLLYGATALSAAAIITPTPMPTVAPPKDTVREGDKGDDAKAVQQRLKDLGYYTEKVDGKFSAASVKALKAFQVKSGLAQDGVCGIKTRAVLFGENAATAVATAIPIVVESPTMVPITAENVVIIQAGTRGNAVLNLQNRLTELGYYSSRQDGVYLEDDISAVRAFQKANSLKVDGKAGYETQSMLFSENAVPGNQATGGGSLRYGSLGDEVVTLQNRLIELGYLTGTADGTFGLATKTALMQFQKINKLTRDGVAGSKTQGVLYSTTAVSNTADATGVLREGAMGAAVKDMQNRLIALGYLTGSADGKFGAKTSLALIQFQKSNSLKADGIAGSITLSALSTASGSTAPGAVPTPKPSAINLVGAPQAASVRYANWYTETKARLRLYPNLTLYDFTTGISWQVNAFSFGAHADAEPLTANDTANMNRAFGGKTTWTPKAVWVVLSDGTIYLASTHNTPHDPYHIKDNGFRGHICIHFPRTMEQVEAIGPYATSHQKAIDFGWNATQARITQ